MPIEGTLLSRSKGMAPNCRSLRVGIPSVQKALVVAAAPAVFRGTRLIDSIPAAVAIPNEEVERPRTAA